MYIKRAIDKELLKWKDSLNRKPLLLRGARQVGKTETVRNLGRYFEYFLEVNFESDKEIHSIFKGNLSPSEICENLSAVYNVPVKEGKTLLFFDEIQECIGALQSLRFFYEKMPQLHLITAGSLVEFVFSEVPSFGVGRIRSAFMYPLSFNEFLLAFGENNLVNIKQKAFSHKPLTETVHNKLLEYLRKFLILGGMPEVILNYLRTKDLSESRQIISDLLIGYYDDFAKYKKRVSADYLRGVFNAVVMQTGNKFVYSKVNIHGGYKKVKEVLELLVLSGLVIPVEHTSANGLPLGAEVNLRKRKMFVFDTGLFLHILGLNISDILLAKDFTIINKGVLAEMFAGLELVKYQSPYQKAELYYWHREAKNSNAEVDYLISKGNNIIPIEIKAGTKGTMRSLTLFMKEKHISKGIRISMENFSRYGKVDVYPLYAIDLLK